MNRILRKQRALSPIFATLILIAITVGAGIMVYMFSSGYLATMMGSGNKNENVAIEAIQYSGTTLNAWSKSLSGAVKISEALIKDSTGATVQVIATAGITAGSDLPATGTLTNVTMTVAALTSGNTYTVTLISSAGNQFVSAAFKA